MAIVLFALIGAAIKANTAYWICFGVYCVFHVYRAFKETINDLDK